ncbi:Competence protein A [Caloramator mitchellensis]|uniref:Competence protein A n=1 Tax=Caloramator mitchellensis TaxID=908809 RepID=A0A0R3K559_CALMK|nr:pilus assembly protein PilM [Caloramator mitchellensis]KRQ88082.1 Competence protein A [Caloramator mitchellensis]
MFNTLCIELSNNYIKIVEGKKGKKITVERVEQIDLKSGSSYIADNLDEDEIYEKLNKFFVENNLKRRSANIILSGISNLLVREMTLPTVPEEKMYNLLKIESAQYFPVNLDKYLLDYKVINKFKAEKVSKQNLLVFAIPRQIIEKVISISQKLKLKINKIDIEQNVLSKMIAFKKLENDTSNMIVSIQRSFITCVVVKNGIIQISKTFPYDLIDFYENRNNQEFIPDAYAIKDAIDNITKLIEFYATKERSQISNIYITGELSKYFNFSLHIQQNTGANTSILEKIENIEVKKEIEGNNYLVPLAGLL